MHEQEPTGSGPSSNSPRGRRKPRVVEEVVINPEDVVWREQEYFNDVRDEFAEISAETALEQLLTDGAEPHLVHDRLTRLSRGSAKREPLIAMEALYFQMVQEGDSAGSGIMLARHLQEILSRNDDEEQTLLQIWREVCLTRAIKLAHSLISKGDSRAQGLTFPLENPAKRLRFNDLVSRAAGSLEKANEGFEGFKFRCLGAIAEYAAGAALHEAASEVGAETKVLYPAGKQVGSDNPHQEEGKGIDWVVTIDSGQNKNVLLVQVKAFAFADQGQVYYQIRTDADLERALDHIKARELVFAPGERRDDLLTEMVDEVKKSMNKMMAHARHGEVPVLCLLPSLPMQADEDRNKPYYSHSSGTPTPGLVSEAAELLAKIA